MSQSRSEGSRARLNVVGPSRVHAAPFGAPPQPHFTPGPFLDAALIIPRVPRQVSLWEDAGGGAGGRGRDRGTEAWLQLALGEVMTVRAGRQLHAPVGLWAHASSMTQPSRRCGVRDVFQQPVWVGLGMYRRPGWASELAVS